MVLIAITALHASDASEEMNWSQLRNPFLEYPDRSIKDFAAIRRNRVYHLYFSSLHESRGEVRCHVMETTTRDFLSFTPLRMIDDGADEGWMGMASPDISESEGLYYLTYNSWGDIPGKSNQLFYRVSSDLETWSERKPLAANLTRGARAIDAAIARHNGRVILIWKAHVNQPRMAWSNSIAGNYKPIGSGYPTFLMADGGQNGRIHENYQFIKAGGKWRMLATGYTPHEPFIYELEGDGDSPSDWLRWVNGRRVEIPRDEFNSHDTSNASAILDNTSVDGFYHLIFAGNSEIESYLGRGWNRAAIARSRDLVDWETADSK